MDSLTTKPKTSRRRAIKNKDKKTIAIDQTETQEFHGLVLPDPVESFGEVAFANGKLVNDSYEPLALAPHSGSFVSQNELGLECLVKDESVDQPVETVEQPVESVEQPVETVEQPVETVDQPVERIKCTCGSIITKKSLTKHLKTAKHLYTC